MLLTLVFPTEGDFDQKTAALPIGSYTASYLEMLVRANPTDWSARTAFARQLERRGDFQRALAELEHIPRNGSHRTEVDGVAADIAWARVRSLALEDPRRPEALADVVTRLQRIADEGGVAPERLSQQAEIALQVERPLLASSLFTWAGQSETGPQRAALFAKAARWSLAGGQARRASELFGKAARLADASGAQSMWARQAVAATEAGGDSAAAADQAAMWVALRPHDADLLAEAARVSLAANRPRSARDFGRRLLRERPGDVAERERQAIRELAAGDPEAAWPLVQEAVRRYPSSTIWREREARTAEWTGRPELALRAWLWLAGGSARRSAERRSGRSE